MKVELTPDVRQWVASVVETGRFATAEDAVRYAVNKARRDELKRAIEAADAEGGEYASEDILRHVAEELDRLDAAEEA